MTATLEVLYEFTIGTFRETAYACEKLITSKLDLSPEYDGHILKETGIMAKCNCADATSWIKTWATLPEAKRNENDIVQTFFNEGVKYPYFVKVFDASLSKSDEIDQVYAKCRDKVAEITIARNMARPLKPPETRKDAMRKSKAVMGEVDATVPPKLARLHAELLK